MSKKLSEGYTINYIITLGTTFVGNGETSIENKGHKVESITLNAKAEVAHWFEHFGNDNSISLISVIRHSDHMLEKYEIEEICERSTS